MNLLLGGHYATETFGVKALAAHLAERFAIALGVSGRADRIMNRAKLNAMEAFVSCGFAAVLRRGRGGLCAAASHNGGACARSTPRCERWRSAFRFSNRRTRPVSAAPLTRRRADTVVSDTEDRGGAAAVADHAVVSPTTTAVPKRRRRRRAAAKPAIDWEAFLGVKLFAWLGGFVLFLGVVFLVKYSFENNLITPFMRVVLGAVIGLGLVAGGWFTALRNYRVPGQSLCATGVLVLYADIFGARAFYGLISLPLAFALMSVVTVAAFLLAVNLNAQVVVVLGLVGGFLTPLLLSSGAGQSAPAFRLCRALECRHRRRRLAQEMGLPPPARRARNRRVGIRFGCRSMAPRKRLLGFFVFLGLQAQFLAFAFLRQRQTPAENWSTRAALTTGFAALGFGFRLLCPFRAGDAAGVFLRVHFSGRHRTSRARHAATESGPHRVRRGRNRLPHPERVDRLVSDERPALVGARRVSAFRHHSRRVFRLAGASGTRSAGSGIGAVAFRSSRSGCSSSASGMARHRSRFGRACC